jgi:UDP-3-O-[3-hydroxymyristoyl] glucosamine N-acyltransferase
MEKNYPLKSGMTVESVLALLVKSRLKFDVVRKSDGVILTKVGPTRIADAQSISFIDKNRKDKMDLFEKCNAGLLICDQEVLGWKSRSQVLVICEEPCYFFSFICTKIVQKNQSAGIDETARIGASAKIGRKVSIGAFSVIGEHVEIGAETVIESNVTIYDGVKIGKRVIVQSGCRIGSSGFGYHKLGNRVPVNFPHLGNVIILDHVEIGSNTCIDRGCFGATIIGKGSKIDNLVHIGHNVSIGENVYIGALSSIAGSTKVNDYSTIWTGVSVADGKIIGKMSQLGIGCVAISDVDENKKMFGNPGRVYGNVIS